MLPTQVRLVDKHVKKDQAIFFCLYHQVHFIILSNLSILESIHVYSRRIGNNTYQWSDGTMIPASQWCPGWPAENTGCVGFQKDSDSSCPQGGLYEIPCSQYNRFFCV